MGNFGSCFSVSEKLSISQQHCLPLTYLIPFRTRSKTFTLCGTPDPFTAESTLKELLTALILLFLPLISTQWHKHHYWQEAVAATVVAEDNRQQHSGQLRFCSSEEEKRSLFQGITWISTRIILKLEGRNYSAIIVWPYMYKSNTIIMLFLERK